MKKIFSIILCAVVVLTAGCSGVSQEEYNSLMEENSNLKSENNELKSKYDTLVSDTEDFRKLSEDEKAAELARAEKDRIEAEETQRQAQEEADRLAAEREAKEEEERKAEEEARFAEEAKGYETGITFEQLARNPDDYRDKKVKFTGSVLQVIEGEYGSNSIRLATDGGYDDVILANYSTDIIDFRLLEDDEITIYGVSKGLKSYETIMGSSVTLPYVLIDRIEF
ncbi:MAG: PCRF domain-containing protein [Ruminococcaceae bacterium]|nr:PCRF domain-containing protein [Oscillospiraceae bacterium]